MKKLLIAMIAVLLISCNTQPVEVTVKLEQPRDTVFITKEVHDTVFIGNIKNKNDLENIAIYAMRTKNRMLYRRQYDKYEYKHFGYTCGDNTIVGIEAWKARAIVSADTNLNGCMNCFSKIALPKKLTNTSLKDGRYGIIGDDTLRCSVVKNKMLYEAWNISKDGKISEVDTSVSHHISGWLIKRRD